MLCVVCWLCVCWYVGELFHGCCLSLVFARCLSVLVGCWMIVDVILLLLCLSLVACCVLIIDCWLLLVACWLLLVV